MAKEAKQSTPDYWRAAQQRLECAEFLLGMHGFRLEAMYLAGYAVECSLKALIVARTPVSKRATLTTGFTGSIAHNYDHLTWHLSKKLKCPLPRAVVERMRPISTWSTDLRYAAGLRSHEDAKAFVDAAISVRDWVERSL